MATYPIKMLRDEDRQAFVPFTNAAAVVDKDNKSLQELMDSGKYKIQNNVTTSSAGKGVLDAYQGKVLNDKFNNYVPLSQKGVANGVASLDAEGKVPSAQLPSYVDDVIESYIVSGSTALSAGWLSKTNGGTALTPEKGKIYLIMTSGAYQNKQYRWGGSTYVLCNPSDVNSVNGMTGVVTLKKLTIQKNGTQVGDTFNGTTDEVINITVPTNNNQLTNGAGYITSAGSITGNAATATKATQDSAGNVIVDTYVKKTGDTMTGNLTIMGENLDRFIEFSSGTSNGFDWRLGHLATGNSDENYFVIQSSQETGPFTNAMRMGLLTLDTNFYGHVLPAANNAKNLGSSSLKWANVYATTFQGNATSATKATQDGNGKVIASTYLPLAGGTMTGPITLKGLVAQEIAANTDLNTLTHGIYHTGTDANTKTLTNAPTTNSQGVIVITPYNSGTDNRTVQLSLDTGGSGALYYRTLRNQNTAWQTVVTSSNISNYKSGGTKAALTIQKNGTTVKTFDGSTAVTANITVPTKVSELTNDSNYVKNTTYASASTAGVVKLGTGLAIADGVLSVTGAATADSVEWSVVKNRPTAVSYWTNDAGYIKASNTMKGATATTAGSAGTVPAPAAGKEAQFLRGDGTWAVPSYATSAGSATKATQDGNGKTIASTYLPLTGGTLSGDLNFSHTGAEKNGNITWNGGTYRQRLLVKDNSTAGDSVFAFQQSADSGANWTNLLTISDTGGITAKSLYLNSESADPVLIQLGTSTYSGSYIYAYPGDANGNNIVIRPGGNFIAGSGEGPQALRDTVLQTLGTETTWLTSDQAIYLDVNCQTIDNRVGFMLNTTGVLAPTKADVKTNNFGAIGEASYEIANIYSHNYNFQGNATMTYNTTDKCIEFNFK